MTTIIDPATGMYVAEAGVALTPEEVARNEDIARERAAAEAAANGLTPEGQLLENERAEVERERQAEIERNGPIVDPEPTDPNNGPHAPNFPFDPHAAPAAHVHHGLYVPHGHRPSEDEIAIHGGAMAAASKAKDAIDRAPPPVVDEVDEEERAKNLHIQNLTAETVTLEDGRELPVYGFVDANHNACDKADAVTCVAGINGDVFIPMDKIGKSE